MDMSMMGNIVYWHKNQVIIWARSKATQSANQDSQSANSGSAKFSIQALIDYIQDPVGNKPRKPGPQPFDTIPPRPTANSARTPDTDMVDDCLLFYHASHSRLSDMGIMQGVDGATTMASVDSTLAAIENLKTDAKFNEGAEQLGCTLHYIPHWLWTATDDESHGCPVSPPIPVEDAGEAGCWKLAFHHLADPSLQKKTGEGVKVFVLDTLPPREQIASAAQAAPDNMLLQSMTSGMSHRPQSAVSSPAITFNFDYDAFIPDPSESATTGKDIYGRLVGFPMADHGTAIAGIIRDLAPGAEIECIRVLNDYGVGDVLTLGNVLKDLKDRMGPEDVASQPVVVNLSLVITPPGNGIPEGVTDDILQTTKEWLRSRLQALAKKGAVITASAGNDSDPRDTYMNPTEIHFGPRYPAALAYEHPPVTTMIPVGAVNQKGEAAIYSNYPGPLGIATYAGELPQPDPWMPSAMSNTITRAVMPVDALRCVYTSPLYPALSVNDASQAASPDYPLYEASNSWAYWSGTSFATPIISALAARILQGHHPKELDVRQTILEVAGQRTLWRRVGDDKEDIRGPLVIARQQWQAADDDNDA